MAKILKLDGVDYDIEGLSGDAQRLLVLYRYSNARVLEIESMHAVLQRAKNSYIEGLKKEIVSNKAGFFIDED